MNLTYFRPKMRGNAENKSDNVSTKHQKFI